MKAKKIQAKIQKFGALMSAMVMPNIGVFIGWGVLTALFIDTGWCPNKYLNELVSPILTYLLPALIGYTAGSNVYGRRGGVIGAFATMGVVIGADITMLVGGMIMGPLAAVIIRKFDKAVEGKVKPGLEMLVDNFSLGLIGVVICILGYIGVAPVMTAVQNVLTAGVNAMMKLNLLPLTEIFVQPAEVLFLNNAINHGIMTPLGLQQASEFGKSVLFLVEANGGPWVGLALAFAVFGKGIEKKSAPGAVLIMFFGGIVEVVFPYALTLPLTVLGPMLGSMFSMFVVTLGNGGTVGPVSPGSVLALYMMTPKDSMLVNTIAYFGGLLISFLVAGFMIKLTRKPEETAINAESLALSEDTASDSNGSISDVTAGTLNELKKVIFACDAGMGSSAMGVSILKTRLQKAGLTPEVSHVAVASIPSDADVVVTNVNLAERAKEVTGGKIPIITLENFMDQKEYDRIVVTIQQMLPDSTPTIPLFDEENIVLNAAFADKKEAINACADILINRGYADAGYRQDMLDRDADVSVYLGNGVALPHGLTSSKESIKSSGICFIQVPGGVDFDGETAYLLVGVAGKGEEHLTLIGSIAECLCEPSNIDALIHASTKQEVLNILNL